MANPRWNAWATVAVMVGAFALVGLLLPAGTAARGANNPPGNVQCSSAFNWLVDPAAEVVIAGAKTPTKEQERFCAREVDLYARLSEGAGAVFVLVAGVATGVGVRRKRTAAAQGTDLESGLVRGDF